MSIAKNAKSGNSGGDTNKKAGGGGAKTKASAAGGGAKAKASASAKPKQVTRSAPEPAEEVPELTGSEADYEKLLPLAMAVDLRDVRVRRLDTALGCHNALKGAKEVLALEASIKRELPGVKIADIAAIPSIAGALAYAELRLDHLVSPESGVREDIRRLRGLRRLMLGSAVALAEAGVLDGKVVKKIQEGQGVTDAVDDLGALAILFTANAAKVRGKTPVTAAQVKEAAELSAKVKAALKPKRASKKTPPTEEQQKATDIRDRFWGLLTQRHDLMWRVGAFLMGKEGVAERVPALHSFAGGRRAGKAEAGAEGAPAAGGDVEAGPT